MAKTGIGPMHTMQPAEILVNGDRAIATTTICIHTRSNYKGAELDLESWAHQKQRFVKVDGGWKIIRFQSIYIRDGVASPYPNQVVPPIDEKGMDVLNNARSTFKYLAVSFVLVQETWKV